MLNNKEVDEQLTTNADAESEKTNPEKVKRDIQKDLQAGIGAMTAREAGGRRD